MIRLKEREIDKLTREWIKNASDERAAQNGCRFDGERAQFVVDWMQHYLKLYEGEFAGEPFTCHDWQYESTMAMYGWVRYDGEWSRIKGKEIWIRRFNQALILIPKKNKKALALDTPIPTPSGWTTMGELKIGDTIFDESGRQTTVVDVSPVFVGNTCYDVQFSDGTSIVADAGHLWAIGESDEIATTESIHSLCESGACTPFIKCQYINGIIFVRSVKQVPTVPVRCIKVDASSQMFLAGRGMIPTHNSPTLAAHGLYLTCGDGEMGGKSFFFAKDGNQSREIAGKHSIEMLKQSPELMAECSINMSTYQVTHEPTRSILRPESSGDARTQEAKEGLNGNVLVDELHVVDRRLMNRVSRAGISRMEPMQIEVSTAGNNPDSYGKTRYEYARDVLSGKIIDQRLYAYIAEAPQETTDKEIDADPIKYGRLANPAWGHTIREAEFLADWQSSKLAGAAEVANFKMYRLNIWQNTSNPLLDAEKWDICEGRMMLSDLAGRGGGLGIDLSRTEDMSACVFAVPGDDENTWWAWPLLWMTREYAEANNHLASFLEWGAAGDLKLVDGHAITDDDILPDLSAAIEAIKPTMCCYDETYAASLAQKLETETGIQCAAFRQNHASYANPTLELRNAVRDGRLRHPGNRVLTWQARHVMGNERAGMVKPIKDDKARHRKIDAIQALIMAIHACANRPVKRPSVYESCGPDDRGGVLFFEA